MGGGGGISGHHLWSSSYKWLYSGDTRDTPRHNSCFVRTQPPHRHSAAAGGLWSDINLPMNGCTLEKQDLMRMWGSRVDFFYIFWHEDSISGHLNELSRENIGRHTWAVVLKFFAERTYFTKSQMSTKKQLNIIVNNKQRNWILFFYIYFRCKILNCRLIIFSYL